VPKERRRLDEALVERGIAPTRARARALIMAGLVSVEGRAADKAGAVCPPGARIDLKRPDHPYVSRGGVKLAGALDHFQISVAYLVCADIGSSTGGFVDCLLQRGAARVYAVDTGRVLDDRLRRDSRVIYLPDTNARYLQVEQLPEPVQLMTIDVSFISVAKILSALAPLLATGGVILALIKPQFEAGRRDVGRGGIVRDLGVVRRVLIDTCRAFAERGLVVRGLIESPITGMEGNREFFVEARRGEDSPGEPIGDEVVDGLLRS